MLDLTDLQNTVKKNVCMVWGENWERKEKKRKEKKKENWMLSKMGFQNNK